MMNVMQAFLVRHAHAVDAAKDSRRPLSTRGCAQVRAMARFLARGAAFEPDELWHSSLVRSQETAELLVRRLGLSAKLVMVPELESTEGVALLAARLRKHRRPVALVGHEPHLGALATLLVVGVAEPPLFVLRKCSVVALERTAGRWTVRWHISPELL